MVDCTGRAVLCQTRITISVTARAAKRVDRGGKASGEDKDEVFSDGEFPINTGT